MKDKTVLITGSTDGIGRQTAFELASRFSNIIIHGKDDKKIEKTVKFIKDNTRNENIDYVKADLSLLKDIKEMSEILEKKYKKIDVLINNAGIFSHKRIITPDGFELTFMINYLSHFYLTYLLFPLLKNKGTRIINVSSMAHSSDLDFDNLQGEKGYNGYTAYSYSKLMNILFTFELAERVNKYNITSNCLHPGVINTKLLNEGWGMGGSSVEIGAQTSVFLAASDEVSEITGRYFVNKSVSNPAQISFDSNIRKRLWNLSEDLLSIKFDI